MNDTIFIRHTEICYIWKLLNCLALINMVFHYKLPISLPLKTDVIVNGNECCIIFIQVC